MHAVADDLVKVQQDLDADQHDDVPFEAQPPLIRHEVDQGADRSLMSASLRSMAWLRSTSWYSSSSFA